jgi:hypothetical protein
MTTWLIISLLFVKHFLADFVWQSQRMLKDKGHYGRLGGFEHAGLHAALTYVILMHFLTPQACLMLALFDAFIHYHIDWVKVRASIRLTPEDHWYWVWLGLDQLLHAMTYLVIAFVAAILMSEAI